MANAVDIVNQFYAMTTNETSGNLDEILAPDMVFEGPLLETTSAREYIEQATPFLQMHRGTRMHRQFVNGDDVCSIYEMDVATPGGDLLTLEFSDWIHVRDGKIARQKIYYDPRALASATGG